MAPLLGQEELVKRLRQRLGSAGTMISVFQA